MFTIFKNFVIYVFILSCPSALSPIKEEVPEPDIEHQVQNEIAPALKKFEDFLNTDDKDTKVLRKGEFLGELASLGRKAIKADKLLVEQGVCKKEKELAEEWAWFELIRQQIEYYEENNFPQSYDSDFEQKKIVWDRERLKGKTDHELHEERRYQKFTYYLKNAPNESLKKLRNRLNEANVSVEKFSKSVARAYRLISAKIHDGYKKWLGRNLNEFFHQDVLTALGILLDEMGVSKKLIQRIKNNGNKAGFKMEQKK